MIFRRHGYRSDFELLGNQPIYEIHRKNLRIWSEVPLVYSDPLDPDPGQATPNKP